MRNGHASQATALALGNQGVGSAGLGQGGLFVDADEGAQVLVRLGAGQEMLGGFDGAELALAQQGRQGRHAERVQISGLLGHVWDAENGDGCQGTGSRASDARRSLDHLGDQEQAALDGRGAALIGVALVGLAGNVLAQAQGNVLDGGDRM